MNLTNLGRILILLSLLLAFLGGISYLLGRLGLAKLPGDIIYHRGGFTLYLPLGICILLSVVLTVFLNFLLRR